MQKFLVIGLGGSGGKTQSFLLDELKFRLGPEWDHIPHCWQFVHIDVPLAADTKGNDLADSVSSFGGQYLGIGAAGADYNNYFGPLFSRLHSSGNVGYLARWRPDSVTAAAVPINGGAGAMRGIGRVVTLAAADRIAAVLTSAVQRLNSSEANADHVRLKQFFGDTSLDSEAPLPLVFIISSMAGGSGASMITDVANILRGIRQPNFTGDFTSAFLYTAAVFKDVISGGGAGTLAAISDMHSAMLNKQEWTAEEWSILGGTSMKPEKSGRGAHAVFPIGASVNGMNFGNSANEIFRGFARMMAPLFVDGSVGNDFNAYIQVNNPAAAQKHPDQSRLTVAVDGGKAQAVKYAHFSGWGSVTLNTGRERYLEYSSQRVARAAAEVLVNGHGIPMNHPNPKGELLSMAQSIFPAFVTNLPVDSDLTGGLTWTKILGKASPTSRIEGAINPLRNLLQGVFNGAPAENMQQPFKSKLLGVDSSLEVAYADVMRGCVSWIEELQSSVERATIRIAATYGLELADLVLAELSQRLHHVASDELAKWLAANQPDPIQTSSAKALSELQKLGKKSVDSKGSLAGKIVGIVATGFGKNLQFSVAKGIQEILFGFTQEYIPELQKELHRVLEELVGAMGKTATSVATAAYREAELGLWPKGDFVPKHFAPAVNEITLDDQEIYPDQYAKHVAASVQLLGNSTAAEKAAVFEVLTGAEHTSQGIELKPIQGWQVSQTSGHMFLQKSQNWVPKVLAPYTSGASPKKSTFRLKYSPGDLIENARSWTERGVSVFAKYAAVTIQQWVYGDNDANLSAKNAMDFSAKLQQAFNFASPLIEVDNAMVSKIHAISNTTPSYYPSAIPFAADDPAVKAMASKFASNGGDGNNVRFSNALRPASNAREIFIWATFPAPYSPVVFKDLTEPIRSQWKAAVATNARNGFWEARRARPLREFVNLSPEAFNAFIDGWLVGRATGYVQFKENPAFPEYKIVSVYDVQKKTWFDFPGDPDLLNVTGLGLTYIKPELDLSNFNMAAALLENFPLRMAHCAGSDLSPLDPYWAMIDLGQTLYMQPSPLTDLVLLKDGLGVRASAIASIAAKADSTETVLAAKSWLKTVASRSGEILDELSSKASNYATLGPGKLDQIRREYEIAPELIASAGRITSYLDALDLDEISGSEFARASVYVAPELTAQNEAPKPLTEVEG